EMFSLIDPPRNLVLKNLTESLKEEASRQTAEDLCETHGERLKLFCVDHQQPICVICRDAKDHKKHQFTINEAAEDNKKELRIALMHLRTKLSKFEEEKLTCNKMCTHIQKQAKQTENNIKGEFQKLYQFMRAEEAARIDALRKEAAKKSQAMQIRLINLIAETSYLSKTMKAAETDLEAADLSFMINYDAIKKRAQCTLPDPETPSGALIDEAKHRGNLLFHVWKKMKSIIQYTHNLPQGPTRDPWRRSRPRTEPPQGPVHSYSPFWRDVDAGGGNPAKHCTMRHGEYALRNLRNRCWDREELGVLRHAQEYACVGRYVYRGKIMGAGTTVKTAWHWCVWINSQQPPKPTVPHPAVIVL
ncbi:unnamed protein product, partial [Gadus morhua 'NCC']